MPPLANLKMATINVNGTEKCANQASMITPWATVFAMMLVYIISVFWFCTHGRNLFMPPPDSVYPFTKRLKELKITLQHLLIDDTFIELTDQKLGEGSVGFVFKGCVFLHTQSRFNRKTPAAVKMSFPMPQKSIGLLEEAARMSILDHPNIVRLIAVGKLSFSAFRPMLAIEWLKGGSLAEFFRDEIRMAENTHRKRVMVIDLLHVLEQVALALRYLHEKRPAITHRDVAARNVLLTGRTLGLTVAKLGDFGVPVDFGDRLPIPYLPPEIVAAHHVVEHRAESDVCWECATLGAEPHHQRTMSEIRACFRQQNRGFERPPECPDEFWTFVLRCLSMEQHERPRFTGPEQSPWCALKMLRDMHSLYKGRNEDCYFTMVFNVSNCTCRKHRCGKPIPGIICDSTDS